MKHIFVIFVIAMLSACASQAPLLKQTSSGHAEAVFKGDSPADVADKLSAWCIKNKYVIHSATPYSIECQRKVDDAGAFVMRAMVTGAYSSDPMQVLRWSMAPASGGVLVVATFAVESQNAFGRVDRIEQNGNNTKNELQQTLWILGGS